jgi:hypothetical protein
MQVAIQVCHDHQFNYDSECTLTQACSLTASNLVPEQVPALQCSLHAGNNWLVEKRNDL